MTTHKSKVSPGLNALHGYLCPVLKRPPCPEETDYVDPWLLIFRCRFPAQVSGRGLMDCKLNYPPTERECVMCRKSCPDLRDITNENGGFVFLFFLLSISLSFSLIFSQCPYSQCPLPLSLSLPPPPSLTLSHSGSYVSSCPWIRMVFTIYLTRP